MLAAAYLHDTLEDTETTMMELVTEFGEPIAALVYWLSHMQEGNRKTRTLQSCWRLSRAPLAAKVIKCADIIDNGTNIAEHDPNFAPVFLDEKATALRLMAAVEGEALTSLGIFKTAQKVATREH